MLTNRRTCTLSKQTTHHKRKRGKQMKRKNYTRKLIAFVLCLAIGMTLMPTAVFAQEEAQTSTEVVALREENVKHFDMGDGTYQAISYSHPIHEKDNNGNWQDIDFGMTRKQTRGVATYTNAASGTTFAATYTQNAPLVTLTGEGTSISMTLAPSGTNKNASAFTTQSIATANANAQVSNPQSTIRTIEDAENAKFSSTIVYNDVMPNIDLEYIVDPGTVKENIIVKAPAEEYAYLFSMDLTGLYPELLDDGSIALYNETTKEMDYAIPAPFMYDGLGNMSEDVAYTLVKIQNTYYLKVIANADWINEEGRTFPITIDPTYVETLTTVQDTYISSDHPGTNNNANTRLWVRDNRIPYIKFATPNIPNNNYLHWASLIMYYYYFDDTSSGHVDVSAHQVLEPWTASTITWNTMADEVNYGIASERLSERTAGNYTWVTIDDQRAIGFDITDAVAAWNNGAANNGIALRYMPSSTLRSVLFSSAESPYSYRSYVTYQYGTTFQFTVELQYDEGYAARYSDASQRITSQANTLRNYFSAQLGIDVRFGPPQEFYSYADWCDSGYNESCYCGICTNTDLTGITHLEDAFLRRYHHKNIHNILSRLDLPPASTNGTLAYIGHPLCERDSNGNCVPLLFTTGLTHKDFRIGVINNYDNRISSEYVTLIHEFGHLLGILDHYGNGSNGVLTLQGIKDLTGDQSYNNECLYGNYYVAESISGVPICQGCKNKANGYFQKYLK